jgi:hypothetical protein
MKSVEEQLRAYAGAITADKPLIPQRDPSRQSRAGGTRGPFLVAAATLVVVLVIGAAVALRGGGATSTSATATATAADVTTTLRVSTVDPGPDSTVVATATLENQRESAIEVPAACRLVIAVVTDPPDQLRFPSGSASLTYGAEAQYGNGIFRPEDQQTFPELTIGDLEAFAVGDPDPMTRKADPCEPGTEGTTTLDPGESLEVTKALAIGTLGLRGNAHVTTVIVGLPASGNPEIDIELPEPVSQPINRSDAINLALAQPEVQRLIESLPPESGPTDAVATVAAWPVDGGWQVGYANSTHESAFLVDIDHDGDITSVATSPVQP